MSIQLGETGGFLGSSGAAFFCPNCLCKLERALPVEPLYTREEVCALVPCLPRWLKVHQRHPWMNEPVYMLDNRRRKHRMFTASDIRNLRTARLAQHARRRNKIEAKYEWPLRPQGNREEYQDQDSVQ